MIWSEAKIGRSLAKTVFHQNLVLLPNSTWPGFESDLLVVTPDLYLIDVEIKVARQDMVRDALKGKWASSCKWPSHVWKHYYAVPKLLWKRELLDTLPSKQSGVLLLTENPPRYTELGAVANSRYADSLPVIVDVVRHAQPNTGADKLSHESLIEIARLASMRMWQAFASAEDFE
ncbi:MAG: hypothetical protein LWW96_18180 [Acidovorax sp.]|uniref:hypothetical protein n=1 Tax=Acidovorax sp. TaxID=1872122 RepID=UPI0025BC6289|nr:hypothetical protein [Acidovorax sp.]MCE1194079.1 hypothetical protein [Acidovorax sp.]